jgi:hypothetical protein
MAPVHLGILRSIVPMLGLEMPGINRSSSYAWRRVRQSPVERL